MLLAEETVKQEKKNKRYRVLSKINVTVWAMLIFKAPSATSNTQFSKIGCSFTTQC